MDVSVVIPCRNEADYIERCVRSVFSSTTELDYEVIVCDGMSTDGTRSRLEALKNEFERLKVLDNESKTTPHALNLGLKAADGKIKIILGAHSEVNENFLQANYDAISTHAEAGCVGGILDNAYSDADSEAIGAAMASPFGVGNVTFRIGGEAGYVDTVAFGAYRAQVFEEIGCFDEELVRNQDDEFNYRLTSAGWKIWFDPTIRCTYFVRSSFSRLWKQYNQYGYWKVFVNRKHGTITTLRQLIPAIFMLSVIAGPLVIALISSLAGWLAQIFWLIYAGALVLYFVMVLVHALKAQSERKRVRGGKVALAFLVLHAGYGLGYLLGIWRFVLLRKAPSGAKQESSR